MDEPPEKRSLTLSGHRTSVTLEPDFWAELRRLAEVRSRSLNALASEIDRARAPEVGLASALRVFVLRELRNARGSPALSVRTSHEHREGEMASETDRADDASLHAQKGALGGNAPKDPEAWVTGDEPMTGAQKSYLMTLCEEAGEPFEPGLSKAAASERIDALQAKTGRGR